MHHEELKLMTTIVSTQQTASPCTCGVEKPFSECCQPIIKRKKKPSTAEQLLRARYSAFAHGEIDFIVQSHHTRTAAEVKREEIEEWSKGSEWLGLKILKSEAGAESDESGKIAFHVQYKTRGEEKVKDHYELSEFAKEAGEWKFLDAQGLQTGTYVRESPKIGRNDPCHCGSGKKFKKCHG
jgi:SEC-C motif-containing protein